jgi:adenylate cyclase
MSLLSELRRRNVLRVGAAYVVSAWLIIQVVETIFPVFGFSDSAIRYIIIGLGIGFVPTLVFAWAFEITPEGLKRDSNVDRLASVTTQTGKKLDRAIMVVLAVALGYFAFDKFVLSETREAAIAETAREQGRTEAVVEAYGEHSIAVLPFVDMSPDKDQEYMSDGIAEELLNLLAAVRDLRVISRSSAFSFKGEKVDIPTVSQQLDAAYILEGSVRKAGDQLRITAQLIEGSSDTHIWSKTYDRKLENIFDIQDEIAAAVVDELKIQLLGDVPRVTKVDEEAYTLVLQARYFWNRRAPGDEEKVLEIYERVLAIDPDYAPAWAGLAVAYLAQVADDRIERESGLATAREAAEKALELDPNLADTHVRMGQVYELGREYAKARQEYQKAFELEPRNPLVLAVMGLQRSQEGRIDDAINLFGQASSADPLGAIWHSNMVGLFLSAGRLDEAEIAARKAFELNSNLGSLNASLAEIYILHGEFDKALELLSKLPQERRNLINLALAYQGAGRVADAEDAILRVKEGAGPFLAPVMAMVHAQRGENDKAFEWLNQISGLPSWLMLNEPYFQILHDDPRWKPYVDGLNWPWEYEY